MIFNESPPLGQMAELYVFYGEFWAMYECVTLRLACHIQFQKHAFVVLSMYCTILHSSMLYVTNVNWRDTKTQSSFSFFYYRFYNSVSYIDSSLHVNQDSEVDSGLELCCKCSRMKEREGEYSTSYCQVM